jgi:tetratricopeptide (TPR) repeat protein
MCFAGPVSEETSAALVRRLWDFRDPADSQRRFEAAARAANDPVRVQVLRTQVARAQGLQGAFTAGHASLDAIGSPSAPEPEVRVLLERGRLLNSAGDQQAAAPLFRHAYDRALVTDQDGLAVDAAHMLAIVLPPQEHEEWAQRGLELAQESADPLARSLIPALLNNLGWTYADSGRWVDALERFDAALRIRRELGDAWPLHVARWTRARALRGLGRHAEALAELRELAGTPEGADDPYVSEEIAENSRALSGQNT